MSTQGLGEKFIAYLEQAKQWQEDWYEDCRRWQNEFVQAIYTNRETEHWPLSVTGKLERRRVENFERTILQSLYFPEMEHRCDRIAEAYSKTFQWIYQGPGPEDRPWASFTEWLEHDSNLYWITGKAGSGKSTLMKYIYHDERILKHLTTWSPDYFPLTAAFFFWSSGSNLQMSHEGLLRSLLFQLLKQLPSLIPSVFPERWEVYNLFGGGDILAWNPEELRRGFKSLAVKNSHPKKYCLFIDGLDEFNEDHTRLISVLKEVSSSDHIKICVSSRPWVTFEDAFKHSPNLILENLTYPDIKHFVHSQFEPNADFTRLKALEPEYAGTLLDAIIQKAAGVFLWVNLVVYSLLAGLSNADRVADLKRRLDYLPPDLEHLYDKMLNDLDSFYFEHASQYFRLIRASQEPLTLLRMFFADEEPESLQTYRPLILDDCEKQLRAELMRRRINVCCKGLLEVSSSSLGIRRGALEADPFNDTVPSREGDHSVTFSSSADLTVQYLHRTVKDFLESPKVWSRILGATQNGYNPYLALCRSCVLQLKCMDPSWLDEISFLDNVKKCLQHAYLAQENLDGGDVPRGLIVVLDELDSAAAKLIESPEWNPNWLRRSNNTEYIGSHRLAQPNWTNLLPYEKFPIQNFLSLAVRLGLYFYVEDKVNEGCLVIQQDGVWSLLLDAIAFDMEVSTFFVCGPMVNLKVTGLLLSRGADPNWKFQTATLWKTLLETTELKAKEVKKARTCRTESVGSMSQGSMLEMLHSSMEIVVLFLQNGADRTLDVRTLLDRALDLDPLDKSKLRESLAVISYKNRVAYKLASVPRKFGKMKSKMIAF